MQIKKQNILKIILVPIFAGIFLSLFLFQEHNEVYQYEIGKPWIYDFLVAKNSFSIYKTEQQIAEEKEEIIKNFVPYFTLRVSYPYSLYIMSLADREHLEISGRNKIYVVSGKTAVQVPLSKIHTPRSAYEKTKKEMLPNLIYDSITSQRVLQEQMSQISMTQGMVQIGEKIIDRGEIVTAEKYQILYSFFKYQVEHTSSSQERILKIVGFYGFIIILITLFLLYLYTFRFQYYKNTRDIIYFFSLSLLSNVIAFFAIRGNVLLEYAVPYAWIPILAHTFYDSRTALFLHLMNVMLISCIVPHPFSFLIMQICAGMVVVVNLRNLTRRSQLIQTATWVILSYILTYTFTTFITYSTYNINLYVYLLLLFNGILIICSYGLIYLFERIFKKTSDMTLIELADMNSAVLSKLAEKAPGTFQHSLQVSTLATVGARSIGANFRLVRTAALYHDIGKIDNAWFFTENQRNGYNPLLEKSTAEATEIIKQHVIRGIEKVKENHLPNSIIPFIKSHHGTSVVRYFYNIAVNNAQQQNGQEDIQQIVNIDDFKYPGPKPQTKEEAILMMADVIEARSRSLKEFTIEKINEIVNDTIDMQIKEEQFIETDLSFRDIATLRKVFVEHIMSINHIRIEYPKIAIPGTSQS